MKKKQSFYEVWMNNWYLVKLCFKSSPLFIIMTIIDGIRAPLSIFFEHTYGVGYVLEAAEFQYPFRKVLFFLVILTLGVSAGMLFTVVVGDYLIEKEKPKLKRKIKMMMYEKAQEVDLASYDKPDFYNELVLAINEGDKQIERCSTFLKNTFSGIVAFATTGFYFIYKDKCSILFVASSFVVVFLSNKALNRLQYSIRIESNPFERKRDYVKRIYYLGNYAKELRLNPQINKSLYEDFEESNREIYAIEKSNSKKKMLYRYMSTYIGNDFFNDVAYVIYLIIRASISGLPISSVAILYRNFGNLKEGMSVFTNTYPYACETSLYIQKIRDFLASKSDIISEKNFELNSNITDMDAKNISFSYSPEGKDIIQDVSMHIKEGEKIAIVGYNGAGKTTLVKLLMRLYDVNSGRISVNGHDIKDYSVDNYRSAIGTVFQDFKLFAGSIYENVLMDNKSNEAQMQRKKVIAALEKSGLYEKVMELPDKEETMITTEIYENGVNLSGGESQKLAISRIFFRDVGLFIMDEPSSALDPIAEYQLNQTLLKETLGKAVIFISHRLSTTRFADRIIMMENGKIVEEGNHRELIELNGKYARMWNAQAGPYIM